MVFCVGITSYFVSERDDANGRKRFFFAGEEGLVMKKLNGVSCKISPEKSIGNIFSEE